MNASVSMLHVVMVRLMMVQSAECVYSKRINYIL